METCIGNCDSFKANPNKIYKRDNDFVWLGSKDSRERYIRGTTTIERAVFVRMYAIGDNEAFNILISEATYITYFIHHYRKAIFHVVL